MSSKKYFSRYTKPLLALPNLVAIQRQSYDWLLKDGLRELFREFSPINDYSGKKFELEFVDLVLDEPQTDEYHAKYNQLSYEVPLRITFRLKNKIIGTEKDQQIFLTDFPLMTAHGTFIINGNERVVVSQLARSFGIFFTENEIRGHKYFGAKVIPSVGAWLELETDIDDAIYARIDRKRKFPVTALLRVLADLGGKQLTDEEILKHFAGVPSEVDYPKVTLSKDHAKSTEDAYLEVYRRVRDSELATAASAKEFLAALFSRERYDLSVAGRVRFNERFGRPVGPEERKQRTLSLDDLLIIVTHIILLNNTKGATGDDIDHLGLRRVRCVGEMMLQKLRVGMVQMRRNIQDRMSTVDSQTTMPTQVINPRPLQARLREFFTSNQLSQFMNQKNILSELEHMRTLSALGPGGLNRKHTGLEVRDVHPSHYGRICPIHTPEGPNIGLILHLANYARINEFGTLETPFIVVKNGQVTDEIKYLNAAEEENFVIAHGASLLNEDNHFVEPKVEVRIKGRPGSITPDEINYMDVAPYQPYSISTSLIPFLEHDDANRALMGSNMQKQSVPCIQTQAPLVATGIEGQMAQDSGRIIRTKIAGEVVVVDASRIVVRGGDGKEEAHRLLSFERSNDNTILHHRPVVRLGQKVKRDELLADGSCTVDGEIALGQNALVAFMTLDGANYEDAIVISERLVCNQQFSSIHIEEFVAEVRETKLGPEITTHDIPNVSEAKLRNLDEEGIIRLGAEIGPGDILVGKITPKGEKELTPEERLLLAIFGEKSRDVKDSSLRLSNGKKGKVVRVKVFSRERGDRLDSGVIKRIHIEVAQLRHVSVGDKLAGRHGNKGVIARVLPEEDMPYMADGTPIDIVLTPLGVPSRMNLGQIFEMHLGMAAKLLGYQAITPPFTGVTEAEIKDELAKAGLSRNGKVGLHNGKTGERYKEDVAVGLMYFLKLDHMVEDKLHMRSIGPYSLITQQPLGGKAQRGGQRFGEMEVWALEGYGAAYTLREMMTIKSDDILGRSQAFDSIVRGEDVGEPGLPASFKVLFNELRGLGLDVELKKVDEDDNKE